MSTQIVSIFYLYHRAPLILIYPSVSEQCGLAVLVPNAGGRSAQGAALVHHQRQHRRNHNDDAHCTARHEKTRKRCHCQRLLRLRVHAAAFYDRLRRIQGAMSMQIFHFSPVIFMCRFEFKL
jgi:hypothetical protein